MAEGFFFGIAEKLLIALGSYGVQEIAAGLGIKKEVKKLERVLTTIKAVLVDAEEQELNSHEVKNWLKLIKDASYEAEDILDDCATEAMRQELRIRENSINKVCSFAYSIKSLAFRFKISRRIKEVRRKFDEIAADRNRFKLIERVVAARGDDGGRSQTSSGVDLKEVFGRDGDKDEMVRLLLNVDGELVIAILGMGGLGKTTLAQLVYADERLGSFDLKMWVCVYQDFNVKKVTEKIIKSATNQECPNLEMDQLQLILREHLKDKKFLLVLDDVWNEDSEKWGKIKFLLSSGAKGSKVVITTRSAKVASIMGSRLYCLNTMSDEDCWDLFKQRAFATGKEEIQQNLVIIGKEIVRKCHGVPLAAKTLGSLLHFKTVEREWESVRDNDAWDFPQNENDIIPALRLSYNHLPFYLKQCFAFCALYPKGTIYRKNYWTESWIAQGYVHSSGNDLRLEDVANEYVKELLWRSLFSEPEEDSYGVLVSFKVHDLVHDLARDVAGMEFIVPQKDTVINNYVEVRHLNLFQCLPYSAMKVVRIMLNLRSLIFDAEFPADDIFSNCNYLRSLDLCVDNGSFPSSIGKLKHLRMLTLRSMTIHTIPYSITRLLNLQVFNILDCPKVSVLPKDIGKMINLRHIYLADAAPLSHMPSGLKNLTSLQTLSLFVVGKGIGSNLKELQGLTHLTGQLIIKNLQNSIARDCADANLKHKKNLEVLELSWNGDGDGGMNGEDIFVDVLEALQPPSNVKRLEITGYGGSRFHGWMMEPVFPNLIAISLVKCRKCECLPPFGQLPFLKALNLEDMDSLRCIEGNGIADRRRRIWFPSLTGLGLERIPNLEGWILDEQNSAVLSLPGLEGLVIRDCPKLKKMPLLPSIEDLEVEGCSEKLLHSLLIKPNSPNASLRFLKIKQCGDLESLSGLQGLNCLDTLIIKECPRLIGLPTDDGLGYHLTSLKKLKFIKLPKMVSLPHWVQSASKLLILRVEVCEGLTHLVDTFRKLMSLRHLSISKCDKLESLPEGIQQLTALETLRIFGEGLMSWPQGMENLTSLKNLVIGCSMSLPYLPQQLEQLTTLRFLGIVNCQTLLTLPEYIKGFTSLQILGASNCQKLRCLPEWMPEVTALRQLDIDDCEQLTSRCKKEIGEDWYKIAHVPRILLNGETIQDK